MAGWRRRYRGVEPARDERGLVAHSEWHRPGIRFGLRALQWAMLLFLLVVGLGPILWLAKSAITPTQDTLRMPMALWPHGIDLDNLATAWNRVHIDRYFFNTLVIAAGAWLVQIVVATTAGYALSVLRPRYAPILTGLVLATLFVPAVVLLVPLYLTVLDVPLLHVRLIDSFWAVWLPAGASAFNVIVVKRFFDNLPREVFEAARTDGAGPFRLFWSIVLPMSRPVLGVVSVFAVIATWKDYLWPLLVLPDPDIQPLSVRLPNLQQATELDVFLAALASF
jgi:multiple sugar transport system permease protein